MRSRVALLSSFLFFLRLSVLRPSACSRAHSWTSLWGGVLVFLAASQALPLPSEAVARRVIEDGAAQLEARLVVSSGPDRRVGVLFDLAPGWHLYWRNPGDTGIAPKLEFRAPGHAIGEILWPAPRVFEEADGLFTTYGYEGRVLLGAPIEPDPGSPRVGVEASAAVADPGVGAAAETVAVEGEVLICRTECIPASFALSSPLNPDLAESQQRRIDAAFADALERAPVSSAHLGLEARAGWIQPGERPADHHPTEAMEGHAAPRLIRLVVQSCPDPRSRGASGTRACPTAPSAADTPLFVPFEADTLELSGTHLRSVTPAGNGFALEIAATLLAPHGEGGGGGGEDGRERLHGLVPVRDASGRLRHVEIDVPIGSAAAVLPGAAAAAPGTGTGTGTGTGMGWAQILLLAWIGGLVLNGMPCVLPVLAIKIFALAELAERERREIRLQGLAYTAGVLGSMAILAAVVIGLRAAGHSVGWGFQFQEPLFVAGIAAVIVAFALNLFGVFEIELGQGRLASVGQDASGTRRSLFEGLLAVVLATPCTAPFLGTAVGFAFAASGPVILSIFLAIGLGLASPFLAVSFFPAFARFIPRSGPWMLKLRAGLGFCLLATAVWLLWVLGQSGGAQAVVQTVAALLLLAFLLWVFGQLQPLPSVWIGRTAAATLLGLSVAGFNAIDLDPLPEGGRAAGAKAGATGHTPGTRPGDGRDWQPWSPTAVAAALAAGQPSFVVFTADWCITCQVNERAVLDRADIRTAMKERGYALFKADWTRRDERIRNELAKFGRAGVPLYLVYSPDAPTRPRVLSELLSRREVLAALESDPRHISLKATHR